MRLHVLARVAAIPGLNPANAGGYIAAPREITRPGRNCVVNVRNAVFEHSAGPNLIQRRNHAVSPNAMAGFALMQPSINSAHRACTLTGRKPTAAHQSRK